MFAAYAERSALESIALKTAMARPALLLQKPHEHVSSMARERFNCFQCHLDVWQKGDINILMIESCSIQHRLKQDSRCKGHNNSK